MPNIDHRPYDKNDKRHGEWVGYWDNNKLWYLCNYVHGVPHGLDETYNYDGTLWFRGYWNMSRKIGYWLIDYNKNYYLCLI